MKRKFQTKRVHKLRSVKEHDVLDGYVRPGKGR